MAALPPPGPYPADGPPPPKKKTSTLTIVLAVIGGGLLLIGLVVGVGIYMVLSSPKGRAIVGMVGDAVKVSAKAQKAPGTKELRAMGCKQAMVMDVDDLASMMSHLDAGVSVEQGAPFGEMVVCTVNPWGTAPSCERVANTYVGAVGRRPKPFLVNVQQTGKTDGACTHLYDGSGSPIDIEGFDEESAPVLPFAEDE